MSGTSILIRKFLKAWKILNVTTPCAGKMKRDIFRDLIITTDDWRLDVLDELRLFLMEWRSTNMRGLTKPTSVAWCQTLSATIDCARFLLRECGFYYVLLGQLQSYPIER